MISWWSVAGAVSILSWRCYQVVCINDEAFLWVEEEWKLIDLCNSKPAIFKLCPVLSVNTLHNLIFAFRNSTSYLEANVTVQHDEHDVLAKWVPLFESFSEVLSILCHSLLDGKLPLHHRIGLPAQLDSHLVLYCGIEQPSKWICFAITRWLNCSLRKVWHREASSSFKQVLGQNYPVSREPVRDLDVGAKSHFDRIFNGLKLLKLLRHAIVVGTFLFVNFLDEHISNIMIARCDTPGGKVTAPIRELGAADASGTNQVCLVLFGGLDRWISEGFVPGDSG